MGLAPNKKKIYIIFFLIAILSVMPIAMGGFLFEYHHLFKFKTLNHGILINPPIQAQELSFDNSKQKRWQLIYMPASCCDEQCEKKLYILHQVKKALGTDSNRLHLVLITQQMCQQKLFSELSERYNFNSYILSAEEDKKLYREFKHNNGQSGFKVIGKIYIVDPMGNLFMYYHNKVAAMDILKDLKVLLHVSQIG